MSSMVGSRVHVADNAVTYEPVVFAAELAVLVQNFHNRISSVARAGVEVQFWGHSSFPPAVEQAWACSNSRALGTLEAGRPTLKIRQYQSLRLSAEGGVVALSLH